MQLLLNNDFITASNENLLLGEKTLLCHSLEDTRGKQSSFSSSKFLLISFHLTFNGLPLQGLLCKATFTDTSEGPWPICIQKNLGLTPLSLLSCT